MLFVIITKSTRCAIKTHSKLGGIYKFGIFCATWKSSIRILQVHRNTNLLYIRNYIYMYYDNYIG